jgi:hypothetical protein
MQSFLRPSSPSTPLPNYPVDPETISMIEERTAEVQQELAMLRGQLQAVSSLQETMMQGRPITQAQHQQYMSQIPDLYVPFMEHQRRNRPPARDMLSQVSRATTEPISEFLDL